MGTWISSKLEFFSIQHQQKQASRPEISETEVAIVTCTFTLKRREWGWGGEVGQCFCLTSSSPWLPLLTYSTCSSLPAVLTGAREKMRWPIQMAGRGPGSGKENQEGSPLKPSWGPWDYPWESSCRARAPVLRNCCWVTTNQKLPFSPQQFKRT